MRRIAGMILLCVAGASSAVEAQNVVTVAAGRVWQTGMRGDLPVHIQFFRSTSTAPLDSAAVDAAARMALQFSSIQPDVRVSTFGTTDTLGLHLRIDLSVYGGGDVRYE